MRRKRPSRWRDRRSISAAPFFRQSPPYNPITGKYGELGVHGIVSRAAMMQVIEADTHDDYVVCRGYDPETQRFLNSVNVGKPYGIRGSHPYEVGQMFPAIKPQTRIGDTPGVAETTTGHPADLDETIEILEDDDENPIWWLLLDVGESSPRVVTVAKDAGVAGDDATDCTWTYTITSLGGVELATGLSPQKARYEKTAYDQAANGTYGLVTLISGSWVLLEAYDEIAGTSVC